MSRWKPKGGSGRSGRRPGRGDARSTTEKPVYHTYLMGEGWTLYITDLIPRSEHRPFMKAFRDAVARGGRQEVRMQGTPWGELVMWVYPDPRSAYVETRAQFNAMLRSNKGHLN